MSDRIRSGTLTAESHSCETDINEGDYFIETCLVKCDSHYVKEIVNHIKYIKLTLNISWHISLSLHTHLQIYCDPGLEVKTTSRQQNLLYFFLFLSHVILGLMCNIKDKILSAPSVPSDMDISASETRVPPQLSASF